MKSLIKRDTSEHEYFELLTQLSRNFEEAGKSKVNCAYKIHWRGWSEDRTCDEYIAIEGEKKIRPLGFKN